MFKVELSENVSAKLRTPCFAQSVQLYKLPPDQQPIGGWSEERSCQHYLHQYYSLICDTNLSVINSRVYSSYFLLFELKYNQLEKIEAAKAA